MLYRHLSKYYIILLLAEEHVKECCDLLSNIVLKRNIFDMWFWHLHPLNKYNIISVYNYFLSSVNIMAVDHTNAIWKKEIHLKVIFFAWRLLRNSLPTTDNLTRRHVLHPNAQFCTDDAALCMILIIYFFLVISLGKFG